MAKSKQWRQDTLGDPELRDKLKQATDEAARLAGRNASLEIQTGTARAKARLLAGRLATERGKTRRLRRLCEDILVECMQHSRHTIIHALIEAELTELQKQ